MVMRNGAAIVLGLACTCFSTVAIGQSSDGTPSVAVAKESSTLQALARGFKMRMATQEKAIRPTVAEPDAPVALPVVVSDAAQPNLGNVIENPFARDVQPAVAPARIHHQPTNPILPVAVTEVVVPVVAEPISIVIPEAASNPAPAEPPRLEPALLEPAQLMPADARPLIATPTETSSPQPPKWVSRPQAQPILPRETNTAPHETPVHAVDTLGRSPRFNPLRPANAIQRTQFVNPLR